MSKSWANVLNGLVLPYINQLLSVDRFDARTIDRLNVGGSRTQVSVFGPGDDLTWAEVLLQLLKTPRYQAYAIKFCGVRPAETGRARLPRGRPRSWVILRDDNVRVSAAKFLQANPGAYFEVRIEP